MVFRFASTDFSCSLDVMLMLRTLTVGHHFIVPVILNNEKVLITQFLLTLERFCPTQHHVTTYQWSVFWWSQVLVSLPRHSQTMKHQLRSAKKMRKVLMAALSIYTVSLNTSSRTHHYYLLRNYFLPRRHSRKAWHSS
jgi:hypothetical protein